MEKEESGLHPTVECLSEFTTFEQGLLLGRRSMQALLLLVERKVLSIGYSYGFLKLQMGKKGQLMLYSTWSCYQESLAKAGME